MTYDFEAAEDYLVAVTKSCVLHCSGEDVVSSNDEFKCSGDEITCIDDEFTCSGIHAFVAATTHFIAATNSSVEIAN